MSAIYRFEIPGAPRTKKNSPRAIRRGSFSVVLPSKAYTKWFKESMVHALYIRSLLAEQGATLPIASDVVVHAMFFRDRAVGDLNGYQQALGDFLQSTIMQKKNPTKARQVGAGVIIDDKQIRSWGRSWLHKDAARPRIEVEIEVL